MKPLEVRRIRIWTVCGALIAILAALLCARGPRLPLAQETPLSAGANSPALRSQSAQLDESARARLNESFGRLPLSFEPNRGQADNRVRFLSRSRDYTLFLTGEGAVMSFAQAAAGGSKPAAAVGQTAGREWWVPKGERPVAPGKPSILRMQLVGANPHSVAIGLDELPGKSNYLRGRNPAQWRTNIPTYAKVKYESVYPGVDLVYYGNQGQLEYDFVLAPGADPAAIGLSFTGAHRLRIDPATGDLVVKAGGSRLRFRQPFVYQMEGAQRQTVRGHYVPRGRNRVGFQLATYDRSRPVVIDPSLVFSTYLGGSLMEVGTSIAVDSTGNVYTTGYTQSANFPSTPGAYDTTCGTDGTCNGGLYDAFVTKFNPTGTALIYSTFIGGSQSDYAFGLAVDSGGRAYVGGQTYSGDFPVHSGFQTACANNCSGGDAFLLVLNPTGSGLSYSTYFGGANYDQINAVSLDGFGNVFVAGYTLSNDFPVTPGAFQTSTIGDILPIGFVAKVKPNTSTGSQLLYATYLGGNDDTVCYGLALDAAGDAYVAGQTNSTNYPTTPGALQTSLNAMTAGFVTELNPTGTAVVYSTYLGGTSTSTDPCAACATDVVLDTAGNAYVTGLTYVTDFPVTPGAYQTSFAGGFHDAFVTELNPTGTALVYSTYLGASSDDGGTAIAIDNSGNVYARGNTYSTGFPTTPDAIKTSCPNCSTNPDSWLAQFNPSLSTLVYSTYIGGRGAEFGHATRNLVLGNPTAPNAYVTGFTNSTDFPVTTGAYQTANGGTCDAFVLEIGPFTSGGGSVALTPSSLTYAAQVLGSTSAPQTATLTNTGSVTVNITSISITGTDATDFAQTNTCGSSLAVGANCAISVTFKPLAINTRTATLSVADDATGSPQTVALTGTGTEVRLNPTSLNFGSVTVGSSSSKNVNLRNASTTMALTITSVAIVGPNASDYSQTNTCGGSVAPGATCVFTVTFKPTAKGTRSATLGILDNGGASPQRVSLTGSGS
jgi:Abnormal spindle-like microcephaly-assoc'd, ASPM-SPD-2-Hydin/Beta-propeller repeat